MLETPGNLSVACCITDLELGGAEKQFTQLALGLRERGHRPQVVVLAAPPQPPGDLLLTRLRDAAIPVEFLGVGRYWQLPAAVGRLTRWLQTLRPEIMQCFLHHANVLGSMTARRAGVPYLVSGQRVADRRRNLRAWLARRLDRQFARHVCVSQHVARYVVDEVGLPADKVIVIENGIDTAPYVAAAPATRNLEQLDPRRRVLLFVGRLDAQKRVDWLIDRMPAILAQLPDHDLVIAGRGPLERSLRAQAGKLNVARRIHFAGWRSDLPELLARSEMLLLTSAWEGMPNVVLEAMAASLPVVSTRVEGVEELLGEAATEQTFDGGDATAFLEAVVRLAQSPSLATDLGRRNFLRAESHYSIRRMVDSYVALYRQLVDGTTCSFA